MAFTLRDAIDRVLDRLSEASGVDVQTYAEEPLRGMIQHKVSTLFDAFWWPQFYNPGEQFVLDGSLGVVTVDLSAKIKRWEDVRFVWYKDEPHPLPRAPLTMNPRLVKRRSIAPYNNATKVFRVLPYDSTGIVTVGYRTKPEPVVADTDLIPFDDELIICGACYDYLNGQGLNEGEEAKFANMYETRLKQLIPLQEQHDIAMGHYSSGINNSWQEMN